MSDRICTILCPSALGPRREKVFGYAMYVARCHGANVIVAYGVEPLSQNARTWVD